MTQSQVAELAFCLFNQDEVVVKVDSTKEVLKMRRWVLAAASVRYTAARAGMTGKKNPAPTSQGQINCGSKSYKA